MTRRDVRVARVYDDVGKGERVLVDRLWPRGMAKSALDLDEWAKDVAPSNELRRWYGHDLARYEEFRDRYGRELDEPERRDALHRLEERADRGPLTLLTAAREVAHSHAAVLAELLAEDGG